MRLLRRWRPRDAFTLIELLMVVMIIAILYGILLASIRTVQRHTLQTITRGEIRNIENAWKQYFTHYERWPDSDLMSGKKCLIDADVAHALQGIEAGAQDDTPAANLINPDAIPFMEFVRVRDGQPLNSWGESGRFDESKIARFSYYVLFDHDGDNQLRESDIGELPEGLPKPFTNTLYRSVIVWSYNPELLDNDKQPKVLGSWE